ncbi:tetratricopeptide repeat protein [Rhodanobacter sp. UC4450_H17]
MTRYPNLTALIGLSILAMVWACYHEGLHGPFLFDDYSNLPALGATGPVDTWPTFWRYLTSGTADPTGRPLTLLMFLLDAHDWPADPYPFKRTNLILHLLNGALLALLLRRLGRTVFSTADQRRVDLAAAIGAGMWLLHPLFVSTTLYIVQREAMLPATFTLLGLLAWLHGRARIASGDVWRGLVWIAAGLGGCTVLGVLSKANGILLPALVLVVEYVLLRSPEHPTTPMEQHRRYIYRRSMWLFGWLPTAIVAGYLLEQGWSGLTRGISSVRPWTLGQRLLTEPRVLLDYLELLWLPRPFTPGLFNDHIQASTSWLSPVTTLPAILALVGLIIGAWLLRRRWPALAVAVLFYFVGQSLESSTVALELYFEHRNYLPAMLMFWPLALWLCDVRTRPDAALVESPIAPESAPTRNVEESVVTSFPRKQESILISRNNNLDSRVRGNDGQRSRYLTSNATGTNRAVRVAKLALAAVILLGLGLMTHARANLWGNSHDQALMWARLNPDSPRAQANAAQVESSAGHPERAVDRLLGPLTRAPDQVQLALNLFGAECLLGNIDESTLAASRTALLTTRDPGTLLTSWFERAMEQVVHPSCPQLSYATLHGLLQAALANPHLASNPGRQQDIHYLLGRLALHQGDADTALAEFNQALDLQVRTSAALKQAALLGANGFPRQGLAHLDHLAAEPEQAYQPGFGMPRVHAWVLRRQQYWPKELAHLRATLRDDATKQAPVTDDTHSAR